MRTCFVAITGGSVEASTIDVPAGEVDRLLAHPERDSAFGAIATLGWDEVAVDPNGYRPGGASLRLDEFGGPDPSKDR